MTKTNKPLTCGIVMPISPIDSCSEDHWRDVKSIFSEAIEDAGFVPQLVSDADDVGIIQKRIIQNLYENPIVVCDVSAKNPNVMFELGMRLAFDRPTIIVKDDKTSYSFDTSPVDHLAYPRDLRFSKIVEFKEALTEKIKATYEKSNSDPNYTTFLKNFGTFKVAELKTEVVPQDQMLMEEVRNLRDIVLSLHHTMRFSEPEAPVMNSRVMCLKEASDEVADAFAKSMIERRVSFKKSVTGSKHSHFRVEVFSAIQRRDILELARQFAPDARWLNGPGPSYRSAEA